MAACIARISLATGYRQIAASAYGASSACLCERSTRARGNLPRDGGLLNKHAAERPFGQIAASAYGLLAKTWGLGAHSGRSRRRPTAPPQHAFASALQERVAICRGMAACIARISLATGYRQIAASAYGASSACLCERSTRARGNLPRDGGLLNKHAAERPFGQIAASAYGLLAKTWGTAPDTGRSRRRLPHPTIAKAG